VPGGTELLTTLVGLWIGEYVGKAIAVESDSDHIVGGLFGWMKPSVSNRHGQDKIPLNLTVISSFCWTLFSRTPPD
jgi:hypothetical protein